MIKRSPACRRSFWPAAVLALAVGLLLAPGCGGDPAAGGPALNAVPIVAVPGTHLQNFHQLAANVYAGAQPDDAAGFADLARLGVKTVISVDGATPDQATAAKYGLRYIHLPIGYDGVPVATQEAIAKAIVEEDGKVYIHCHHGMHRGAAAAAAACVVAGLIDVDHAVAAMQQMQTGANYLGLWQDVRKAQAEPAAALRALAVEYKAAQPIPALAERMVQVDAVNDRLKLCQSAAWLPPTNHPDLEPSHESLMLQEHFAELQRAPDYAARPAAFKQLAEHTETKLLELLSAQIGLELSDPQLEGTAPDNLAARRNTKEFARVDKAFEAVQQSCIACHQVYRNDPATKQR